MKYTILYPRNKDIVEYTIIVLRQLIKHYEHKEVDIDNCDIILISVCDITQITFVEKIRKLYSKKKICVGGHASVYYKLFSLFSDYVNIGQGFDFFKCKSINQIKDLKSIYYKDKKDKIIASTYIDWSIVPCGNVTKGQFYYWGAVGCKNKCKYCLTSWTNRHQQNDWKRIETIRRKIKNVTIVTNDSDSVCNRMTQSMMVKDFLKRDLKKYAVYRLGVEFATEENRRKYGKFISDNQFYEIFNRAIYYGVRLKLFFISGIDKIKDWHKLFHGISPIYQKGRFEIKFTNISYEMFTLIKKERHNIDINKMFNTQISKEFVLKYKTYIWPLRECPCISKANTLKRNMLIYTTNMDEYNVFKNIKNKKDEHLILNKLIKYDFFKNDYSDTVKFNL